MEWIVPFSAFWPLAALWLGGDRVRMEGGGPVRQLLGLLVAAIAYVVGWAVLRLLLGSFASPGAAIALATVLSIPIIAPAARIGFLSMGVKVRMDPAGH